MWINSWWFLPGTKVFSKKAGGPFDSPYAAWHVCLTRTCDFFFKLWCLNLQMPQQVLCNQNHCDAQILCRFNRIMNDTWCALSCCQSRPQWCPNLLRTLCFLHTEETPVKGQSQYPCSRLLPHHGSHFDLKITASCCRFHEVLCGWIKVNFLGGALYFYDEQIPWKDQNYQALCVSPLSDSCVQSLAGFWSFHSICWRVFLGLSHTRE